MAEENPNGGGEGGTPQDPGAGEGNTVNRHKYDVDIANRDRRIKELEAKLGESGKKLASRESRAHRSP